MDAFAVKQACKFAKEHALKSGPIVSFNLVQLLCILFLRSLAYENLIFIFYSLINSV